MIGQLPVPKNKGKGMRLERMQPFVERPCMMRLKTAVKETNGSPVALQTVILFPCNIFVVFQHRKESNIFNCLLDMSKYVIYLQHLGSFHRIPYTLAKVNVAICFLIGHTVGRCLFWFRQRMRNQIRKGCLIERATDSL